VGVFSSVVYAAPSPFAETVILNGKVIPADADKPEDVTIAEAVAIQVNRILEIGSNTEIRALVADWTEVIDPKGVRDKPIPSRRTSFTTFARTFRYCYASIGKVIFFS